MTTNDRLALPRGTRRAAPVRATSAIELALRARARRSTMADRRRSARATSASPETAVRRRIARGRIPSAARGAASSLIATRSTLRSRSELTPLVPSLTRNQQTGAATLERPTPGHRRLASMTAPSSHGAASRARHVQRPPRAEPLRSHLADGTARVRVRLASAAARSASSPWKRPRRGRRSARSNP